MSEPLEIYLHDHLAGSNFVIELLEDLRQRYPNDETGSLAAAVLPDIQEDRKTLESIIDRVGKSHFDLKDAMAWLGEKASRIKLREDQPQGLGTFEAMELTALGILGKLSLWRTLSIMADPRLSGWDFSALSQRAEQQHDRVDKFRLKMVPSAFSVSSQPVLSH